MDFILPTLDFKTVYAEIILSITIVAVLMIQAFGGIRSKGYPAYISLAGITAAFGTLLCVWFSPDLPAWFSSFSGKWVVDHFATVFKLIFLLGSGLTVLISIKYLSDEGINHGEYFALILFATLGMMIMASGADFIIIFLGLELMSIPLYVLAGYVRTREISNESGLKYFLLGSFSTGFFLYGVAFLYGASGTTGLYGIFKAVSNSGLPNSTLTIGMALLVIGFGFKIAAVPFHMWTPDVYQGAPSPITAFMSAGPKAAAICAFVRVFMVALPSIKGDWEPLIWLLAALTMTVGNILALVQENVKRMLAYSSIAHAGYVLVAFLAAGELGIASIIFYMTAYTVMNIGAFAVLTVFCGKGEQRIHIEDYRGYGYKHPVAALALGLFLFSLAGIPPTAGFMGKFYVFSAAVKEGFIGLAIIGVLNSAVSVYYYLRLTVAMYMKEPDPAREVIPYTFSPALVLAVMISVYGVLSLGIFPSSYIAMVQQSFLALH